jgi:glutamine amidotransferase
VISIVGSGAGNVGSVLKMIARIGSEARVITTPEEIASAQKLILPGVGAFDAGMAALRATGLDEAIQRAVSNNGATILGICLGMQLLLDGSDEGSSVGLALVPGRARRFDVQAQGLRVPHMGWNEVEPVRQSVLFAGEDAEQRFYFAHSYYVECSEPADVAGETTYGIRYASALQRGRVFGVQFHPEKSHRFGMALLGRFLEA